jgi:hypothetical protein
MSAWAKRVTLICVGLSLVGCAGSRSFTWRGVKARQRARATYSPPAAPTYAPAAVESTSPMVDPSIAPPRDTSPEFVPMPPAEPTPAVPPAPPRQSAAPSLIEEPAILFDEPPQDAIPLELTPTEPKRNSDRPASAHQEQRSAVQELGEGPIARTLPRVDAPLKVAQGILPGHSAVVPVSHIHRLPGHSIRPN